MNNFLLLLTLACCIGFTSCKNDPKETVSTLNLDADGEIDTLTKYSNSLDEASFVKVTANGKEKEFKYLDLTINPDPKFKTYYYRRKDSSGASISFSRATNDDMREKISIALGNIDAETLQYPYEWKFSPTTNARITYEVKKSAVPIIYYSDNAATKMTLTSYKDGVLEGTFSTTVTNTGKRTIILSDGSFKMKLDKIEQ